MRAPMTQALASLVPLEQVPPAAVEDLLDRAFGPDRQQRTAYLIRDDTDWLPALSFALVEDELRLIGSIQVWPVALTDQDGKRHPLLMVGPVAVLPEEQDKGNGVALMIAFARALEAAGPADHRHPPQMLIGDPEYYGRFGFSAEHTGGWRAPGPFEARRLLARADEPANLPREGMLGPWRG